MHYKQFSFSDIIGKRWPNVTKKDVTGKLAEALKPNLFKEKTIPKFIRKKFSNYIWKKSPNYIC
jgi:tagatose-1,6-bisphosphate aldolase non-catalytic subunit AgaZ/GatZ